MNNDLKIIEKKYGEEMSHLCREYFPILLEQEGLLSRLMEQNFEPNHELYNDIIKNNLELTFKKYIYSLVGVEKMIDLEIEKTPEELLNEAGYILYECKSEKDIQKFKNYYTRDEELCTFRGGRLNRCRVFFAVKTDVDNIKRENFDKPQRQDLYGTSVISIQFSKDGTNTLSIKNRYNHRVKNPDATFSNNLDNIILGLTKSFEKFYGIKQQYLAYMLEIPRYVRANDGKYYKYNYEINNIYYCTDNVIIDNFKVKRFPKEQYILIDYFLVDLKSKKVFLYDEKIKDSFPSSFEKIDKIEVLKTENGRKILMTQTNSKDKIEIEIDKENKILKLYNNNLKEVGDYFLHYNERLTSLILPNLIRVGNCFLYYNNGLTRLTMPNLTMAGNDFLNCNESIKSFEAPNLTKVGLGFLHDNEKLTSFISPNLTIVGNIFLCNNKILTNFEAPNLTKVGDAFLFNNKSLTSFKAPNLIEAGDDFLYCNKSLTSFKAPNLTTIGDNFLYWNKSLKSLETPNLKEVGIDFLCSNENNLNEAENGKSKKLINN